MAAGQRPKPGAIPVRGAKNIPTGPDIGRRNGEIETMKNTIETLKNNGYAVYAAVGRDGRLSSDEGRYVFAITPSDNVLYVQRGYFGGWEVSLQYKPSRENGSGCRANDKQPYSEITLDALQEAERENLIFAGSLNAPLYKSSEEWKRGYWTELQQL